MLVDDTIWQRVAAAFAPKPRRWPTPGAMAQALDPTTRQTSALTVIDRELVGLADGDADRLMVFMPPQEGKSQRCSKWFPLWLLEHNPDLRIAIVSYSDEMARRWGADIKQLVEAHQGDEDTVDLGIRLRQDSRAAGRWQVAGRQGGVYCVGIAGALTGKPVDVLIIDDPIKDLSDAQSEAYRKRCKDFWQGVAIPRLGPGARCVLIQTRWHEDDMAGWLLASDGEGNRAKGGAWRVVSIPAIAEEGGDPLGRRPGVPMQSARGERDWARIRKSAGEYVWGALYQQRPSPAEGGLFKRLWWRYWRPAPRLGMSSERIDCGGQVWQLGDCWRFITMDLAASTRTSADWTVASVWAHTLAGDLILLDRVRVRVGEDQHFATVRPLIERWGVDTVFVEASQHGTTLVREATQHGIPISPLEADTDKLTRALPASARCSAGRVWLPAGAPWLGQWVDEHAGFPNANHDDQVDTLAYAVRVAVTRWHPQTLPPKPPPPPSPIDVALGRTVIDFMTVDL